MTCPRYILAIDQGTTSTKSVVLSDDGSVVATSLPERFEIRASYPHPGWVEYSPDRMLETVCQSAEAAIRRAGIDARDIVALGLANQGETVIAFDADSGRPVYPAISWQDRRAESLASHFRVEGL